MRLLVQPRDGLEPLLKAIRNARKSVEIVIFRFDRPQLRQALVDAVRRGVTVRALISYTNRGGEKKLRRLEAEFLAQGISVARTADDLVRYHGKMMLIDGRQLYLLSYNFTGVDLRSRGFGLVITNPALVQDAVRLFEADSTRQPYQPGRSGLVVSPINARAKLAELIASAQKELLIYELKLTDREMLRLLRQRADEGIRVRILGRVKGNHVKSRPFRFLRLHSRTIICDRQKFFVGSQSMRKEELEARREIGVIVRDSAIATQLARVFEQDWRANAGKETEQAIVHKKKVVKKLAQRLAQEIPIAPVAKQMAKAVADKNKKKGKLVEKQLKQAVKQVVKRSAKAAALEILEEGAA
jgi:cardiolipin synthase